MVRLLVVYCLILCTACAENMEESEYNYEREACEILDTVEETFRDIMPPTPVLWPPKQEQRGKKLLMLMLLLKLMLLLMLMLIAYAVITLSCINVISIEKI